MCHFCHAQLFEITHVANIKSTLVQHSCRNAEVVEAFCRVAASRSNTRRPIHYGCTSRACRDAHCTTFGSPVCRRPLLSRCPTSRDFVPWRFLDAGQLSARVFHCYRRPKTSTQAEVRLTPAFPPFGSILQAWQHP